MVKEVSIIEYFDKVIIPDNKEYYEDNGEALRTIGNTKCPFHNEEHASFRYYECNNTFYCFGCNTGGNVIDLHIKYLQRDGSRPVSRDKAVNWIYNRFIAKREK